MGSCVGSSDGEASTDGSGSGLGALGSTVGSGVGSGVGDGVGAGSISLKVISHFRQSESTRSSLVPGSSGAARSSVARPFAWPDSVNDESPVALSAPSSVHCISQPPLPLVALQRTR